MEELKIFSGRANSQLALDICQSLNIMLGDCTLSTFPDGEFHCKIEDVRGRDVFLIQPTCPPVNDTLMELLIMIDTCKRASAKQVTAVIPYFGYARQDRKDEGRVPITAKLVANLVTRAGADRVLAMDLHAAQIQGFFDVPVDHLYASNVLNEHFRGMQIPSTDLVIVSPDEGSIKRAVGHAKRLGGSIAIIDKRRTSALETTQENLIGASVEGKVCLMFDDMISTASSISGAVRLVKHRGAREVHVAATHGLFAGNAVQRLNDAGIDSVVITDTVPVREPGKINGLRVLTVSNLLGEAIRRIHQHRSISAMFQSKV
ncbi:MAG: ribose-phosphate pyrophosphokinase [Planctomycetaceae bacterium]|jgi:ribose-phosphate pyrophosphokinase|nr:ribose-phosphate pyrophosphokinase [Planctomycetaceae bacterium]